MSVFGWTVYTRSKVSSRTGSLSEPQPASDKSSTTAICRRLRLLVRGDRTHELYQRVHVVHQEKSWGDSDDREKQAFTLKIVPGLVFQIAVGDLPKRSRRVARITSARSSQCDGLVAVICHGHLV